MRYVDEFRHDKLARAIADELAAVIDLPMQVCGGHTHTIFNFDPR